MAKTKIFITPEGNVIALCDNIVDNAPDLGRRLISRVANVEFNNQKQMWEIVSTGGQLIGEHQRRDEAIKMEIAWANKKIKERLVHNYPT